MLQLALTALLAGSLLAGSPDDDKDKDKKAKAGAQQPIESILVPHEEEALDAQDPVLDTYALGRTERIPIKFWVGYSRATDDEIYDPNGNEVELSATGFTEARAQRAFVGAQINVINFTNFSVGAGGQLITGQNESDLPGGGSLDSGFGLQNAKVYGIIRGRTLGLHGGYIFDLGDDENAVTLAASGERPGTDQVDAWFIGANFDYPSERFRLFGGIDYFNRDDLPGSAAPESAIEDDELIVFTAGAGIRISFVEIGAAALLRTNLAVNRFLSPNPESPFNVTGGGHQGSIAPYLRLSPPSLPIAISVKGAVLSEYADYGYSLGGASDFVTRSGFTVTASLGF
ncbi:MAG: hypothetical protein AAGI91_00860 [Bacteroidota bacterium]